MITRVMMGASWGLLTGTVLILTGYLLADVVVR